MAIKPTVSTLPPQPVVASQPTFSPQTFTTQVASQLGKPMQPAVMPARPMGPAGGATGVMIKGPAVLPPRPVLPLQANPHAQANSAQRFLQGFRSRFGSNTATFL